MHGKGKDGRETAGRERILKRYVEFYQARFEDPSQDMHSTPAEEVPVVMKSAVEKAICQMKKANHLVKIIW